MIPNILSIAGSDPSGGAGIQADIKAISANGGYAMAALTGLTAQNTTGVQGVDMVAPAMIAQQIASLRADIRSDAVKIGMLGDARTIETVAKALEGLDAPVALRDLGMPEEGIARAIEIALQKPYWNPREITAEGLQALLQDAWAGNAPGTTEIR